MSIDAASNIAATSVRAVLGGSLGALPSTIADARSPADRSIPLDPSALPQDPEKLAEAATEFEAYFLNVLLREMRKTLAGDALFSDDPGSRPGGYQALLDDALARHAARAGGIGLAEQLTRQWEARG